MTDIKVTQQGVEVLFEPSPPDIKVTQQAVEVLHDDVTVPAGPPYPEDAGSVRNTQSAVLVLSEGDSDARVTQTAVLVPYAPAAPERSTQILSLVLAEFEADTRMTQTFALALVDHNPCLTKWCQCWTITRTDGQVFAFTAHDQDVIFRGITHKTCCSLAASAVETAAVQASTGNMDLTGVLCDDSIAEDDLFSGKFDGAYIEVWNVPWENNTNETPIRLLAGKTGDSKQTPVGFTAEVISPGADIQQLPLLDTYSPGCRYKLGDDRCTVDLSAFEVSGVVTQLTVASAPNSAHRRVFIDSGATAADGYFDGGLITWTSGDNTGLSAEIKTYEAGVFVLWDPMLNPITIGDSYTVTPGCNKSPTDCKDKFDNKVNYGGFEYVPGQDAIIFTPDAK